MLDVVSESLLCFAGIHLEVVLFTPDKVPDVPPFGWIMLKVLEEFRQSDRVSSVLQVRQGPEQSVDHMKPKCPNIGPSKSNTGL